MPNEGFIDHYDHLRQAAPWQGGSWETLNIIFALSEQHMRSNQKLDSLYSMPLQTVRTYATGHAVRTPLFVLPTDSAAITGFNFSSLVIIESHGSKIITVIYIFLHILQHRYIC